jgi:hypothetical protein
MATILERLARHLSSHANASDEVEPVSACLQIKSHRMLRIIVRRSQPVIVLCVRIDGADGGRLGCLPFPNLKA